MKKSENYENIISIQYVECLDWIISILTTDLEEQGWTVEYFRDSDECNGLLEKRTLVPNYTLLIFCPWLINNVVRRIVSSNRYIYWNLEQNVKGELSHHFKLFPLMDAFLENAILLLDYNYINIRVWNDKKNKIFQYMPIPAMYLRDDLHRYITITEGKGFVNLSPPKKMNDYLFVGSLNDRRKNIIPSQTFIPEQPVYGRELLYLIDSSKIMLNVHYYDEAIFERARANESLSNGIRVVSEFPTCEDSDALIEYAKVVNFSYNLEKEAQTIIRNYDETYGQWLGYCHDFLEELRKKYLSRLSFFFKIPQYPKLAVITINYGGYEKEPAAIAHIPYRHLVSWFYITDKDVEKKIENSDWNVKIMDIPLTDICLWHNKSRTLAKYVRFRSCEFDFLQDFDYILHVDGNVTFQKSDFVNKIFNVIRKAPNSIFFSYKHYMRNNIYEEMDASTCLEKYKDEDIKAQVDTYHRYGHSYELYEAGIHMYKMCPQVKKFFLDWYREFIYWGTQDQISYGYCLRRNKIEPYILNDPWWKLGIIEGSVWMNSIFGTIKPHGT